MNRTIERAYPIAIAILVAIGWWKLAPQFPQDEKEFLAAAISLGAILTGFIATAKAILAALPTDSVMGRLRSSGYVDDLITYLAEALYGCLAFSVYSIAGFFFLVPSKVALTNWYAIVWMGLGSYALMAFYRVARILMKIIKFNPPRS
jgi:hypothetical protein